MGLTGAPRARTPPLMATGGGTPSPPAKPEAESTGRISLTAGTAAIGGFLFGLDTAVITGNESCPGEFANKVHAGYSQPWLD